MNQKSTKLSENSPFLSVPSSSSASPRGYSAQEFASRVAASLSASSSANDELANAMAACAKNAASYEASVRSFASQPPVAGRMMIEQASPAVLTAIAKVLDIALPPAAAHWITLARSEGVSIITGWDLRDGGGERCVKLYFNASDAWRAAGARLCAAVAPGVPRANEHPAVVGVNVRADGIVETKLYVQAADAVALATNLCREARDLASAARRENADAGGVVSFDATLGALQPRAFFVALREPPDEAGWNCVRELPGYDRELIDSSLPFAPAPPRSVGVSVPGDTWTLYFKPRHSSRAPEALEPVAIFRAAGAEVGVFVEPTERAERAFRRTRRYAVTVRLRRGVPPPLLIEALVDWFTAQLRASEELETIESIDLANPPTPWRAVGIAGAPTREGGPS